MQEIMKAIISNDLKKRVECAAANGSVIAQDLLVAIKNCRDIKQETDKCINYFDSKRKVSNMGDGRKTIRVVVTCCRKDVTNRNFPDYGNPQAPYFPENRSDITVHDFALVFKAIREKDADNGYEDTDWTYFDSAMRLASKVTFRVGVTMADFIKAYDASNYIGLSESDQSSLHGSCMRYEDKARNAADYYVNFAGAKILIGETAEGEVVSRAVLWEGMNVNGYMEKINFIDRTYTAFDGFLLTAMRREAIRLGYVWRKTCNDYCSKRRFTPMVDVNLTCESDNETYHFETGEDSRMTVFKLVPAQKLHKRGCPYCDTMSFLYYDSEIFQMTICNNEDAEGLGVYVAGLSDTDAYGSQRGYICPVCGKWHTDGQDICNNCRAEHYENTLFGGAWKCKTVTYRGKSVPSVMLKGGKPTKAFNAYITLKRICDEYFSL